MVNGIIYLDFGGRKRKTFPIGGKLGIRFGKDCLFVAPESHFTGSVNRNDS
jgi:hypothetical protein